MSSIPDLSSSPSRQYLLRHSAIQGAQLASLVTPFLYGAVAIKTRSFSIGRLLRACAIGFAGVGPAAGAALAYGRMLNQPEAVVATRAGLLRGSASQQRLEDYTIIGAAVGALVVPAIFLKRARLPYAILGGASVGAADGVLTHVYMRWSEGKGVSLKGVVDDGAAEPLKKA
ncbi:hypothetical protein BDY24DRAFT_427901 [Mrakia frigida]|uniref:uncharacterized protein n=1 Tax=Mrakia frigida TaxID=29902 RepID=UPI003FCBFC47